MPGEISRSYSGPRDTPAPIPAYFLGYGVGDALWWRYETHRGHDAPRDVPAFVMSVKTRLGIAAQMRDGSWVPRWVSTAKVRPRGREKEREG